MELAQTETSVAHCSFQVQCLNKVRSRPVSREHANHFLNIVRHTNAEKRYHQCGQLTHFHCTIVWRDPPHLAGSHMSYVSLADV